MRKVLCFLMLCSFTMHAQQEKLTLMSYNLMYYRANNPPCTHNQSPSVRDQELKKVFDFVQPSIFTVNELGAGSSVASFLLNNVLNSGASVPKYDKALSTNHPINQSSLVNMVFFDSTKVGLHSQTYLDKEINGSTRIVRVIDFYRMYYKDPKLKQGADTTFFTLVVGHLKAGNTASDKGERGNTAKAIMKYLTDNVSDENVILCGDFNLYSSSEQAFQQFINYSVSSEKFYDPVNQIGNWSGNSTYSLYHTQSPHSTSSDCYVGGGLDDRFDFYLISDAIRTGSKGIKYKLNSYKVIGNDGNHFNQAINAGNNTSAPSSVISALYNFSDHLPITMDIEVTKSDLSLRNKEAIKGISFNNPSGDIVTIRRNNHSGNLSVTLYNLTGKMLLQESFSKNSAEKTINLSGSSPGVYIIVFSDDNGNKISRKLIKN